MIKTIYKCDCCGMEFLFDRGYGGLSDHEALYVNRKKLSKDLRGLCTKIVTGGTKEKIIVPYLRDKDDIDERINCVMMWNELSEREKQKVRLYSKRLAECIKERETAMTQMWHDYVNENNILFGQVFDGIDE